MISILSTTQPVYWLCGLAVRHSLRDREVRGSIPSCVKPKTLKLALAADPPSVGHCGFSVKSGRPGVRISAPYNTVWKHAFNCPHRHSSYNLEVGWDVKIQSTNQPTQPVFLLSFIHC
ncbi:hypothetical protein ElyMa_000590500 [Elysia marginata]|uniref:Uncharacterized protein n=1 Tax=Elysia marginata TaxID=1093978 RepID=A0AAV4G517_9GAST|nr:hypothetical protein ElyMa_000590500 [Elysia marginata]